MWPPSNKETFSPVVAVKKPPQTESKPRKPAPPLQTQTLDLNQLREQMDNMEESAELLQTVMALNDVVALRGTFFISERSNLCSVPIHAHIIRTLSSGLYAPMSSTTG